MVPPAYLQFVTGLGPSSGRLPSDRQGVNGSSMEESVRRYGAGRGGPPAARTDARAAPASSRSLVGSPARGAPSANVTTPTWNSPGNRDKNAWAAAWAAALEAAALPAGPEGAREA